MTMKLTYSDDGFIVRLNGREVEMNVEAVAIYSSQPQTREDPAYEEFVIDEIYIENAHYTDDNSPVSEDEIMSAVEERLEKLDSDSWHSDMNDY